MENKKYIFPYKKVLILENELWQDIKGTGFYNFYKELLDQGVEFKIIEQAANKDKNEIIFCLMWADVLMFASTFLYRADIKGLGDLLMGIPKPKVVIGYPVSNKNLQHHIEDIWELNDLTKMSHHKVFELVEPHIDLRDLEEPLLEIDMVQYKTKFLKEEEERVFKNHNMPKTRRKVKIGKITAFGPQWSNLKEGDVVDELDCSSIDPNTGRGVWVMGKDEPVKLLNDSGYQEFEYDDLTAEALALEFLSRGEKKDNTSLLETLQLWIYGVSGKVDETELWNWCDELCKMVGVERRGNRHYFERRLNEYRSKHKVFKEAGGDPREKNASAFR